MGLGERWRDVTLMYAAVNRMFGDIVKVTPTSKVVGDLAVYMVTNDLTPEQVLDPARETSFPDSVVEFFHGDLGQPYGGFPAELQAEVLKGAGPLRVRPGEVLEPTDLEAARAEAEKRIRRRVSDRELASYLMYPKVFVDFAEHHRLHGDVSVLPTPVFLFGLRRDDELFVDIERGKTLVIRFLATGDADEEGRRSMFFELNGQPREVKVVDRSLAATGPGRRMADEADPTHIPAPMPGLVVAVTAHPGERVERGDRLLSIEAMKMETGVFAERAGVVEEVLVAAGTQVETKQLLMIVADPADAPDEPDTTDAEEDT
jgi:pyruvate carboxylase